MQPSALLTSVLSLLPLYIIVYKEILYPTWYDFAKLASVMCITKEQIVQSNTLRKGGLEQYITHRSYGRCMPTLVVTRGENSLGLKTYLYQCINMDIGFSGLKSHMLVQVRQQDLAKLPVSYFVRSSLCIEVLGGRKSRTAGSHLKLSHLFVNLPPRTVLE